MSSRKDKFTRKDKFFMGLALNLARQRIGLTGSNPSVGCVIVKNDKILSIGQTSINGRPHAEYNAIKKIKKKIKNSTLYVSLEPCSHYGKTPPCTNLIINSNIKKLFFAVNDIDKRSSNKAHNILKYKGILVRKFLLKNEATSLYKSYFFTKKKNMPYVIGKIACSKDFFISSKDRIITNEHSQNVSHLLRYKNQGILISSKTLNSDNPKLTCRINGLEKYSPTRFILDKNLETKKSYYIVKSAKKIKTYIFYNKSNIKKKRLLEKKGIIAVYLPLNQKNQFDLKLVLNKIYTFNVSNLIVEGGKKLTYSFLKASLFNEFYLFKSDRRLGKKGRINISNISSKLSYSFKFKKKVDRFLDKDKIVNYY